MKLSDYKTFEEAEYALMLKLERGYEHIAPTLLADINRPNAYLHEETLLKHNIPMIEAPRDDISTIAIRIKHSQHLTGFGTAHRCINIGFKHVKEYIEKYDLEHEKEFENNIKKEYIKLLDIRDRLKAIEINENIKHLP